MNPVNWFEIPVTDLARAKRFYDDCLRATFQRLDMGPYQMEMFAWTPEAPGSAGALIQGEGYTPSHLGSMVYFSVPDIEATLGLAASHGGKLLVPKTSIGEHGFIGLFEDSEGNRVGLHSRS